MGWITATELEQWADHRDCQGTLPAVVRLAIHGSGVPIREINFPAGDSVIYPGLDGYLVAGEGSPFVPAGLSVWEIGTSSEIRDKANSDYRKRTTQELGIDRSDATFVFVTPRRWPSGDKEGWIAAKQAESVWRDVRIVDADVLEQWLERVEPAAIRAAEHAGFRPVDLLRSLEEEWAIWCSRFEPRADERLVLAGRGKQAKALLDSLTAEPCRPITLKAHSPDEARAFVAAAILSADDLRISLLARSVVVVEPTAQLGRLRHLRGRIILLPDSGMARDHAAALADAGNHVVLGVGSEEPGARATMELARTPHEAFAEALVGMGLTPEEAHRSTLACGRSATVLRRRLSSDISPFRSFSDPELAAALIPAMLAGGWDETREADKVALGRLAGADYGAWVASVVPWRNVLDPPLRRAGDVWHLAAPVDACALLVPYLTAPALDTFAAVAQQVLGEDDPQLDLPPDERVFADIRGKSLSHSGWLRGGVVRTILLLGVGRLAGVEAAAADHGRRVDAIVQGLLDGPGWRAWASLNHHLPTLAEAAPETFLRALERQIEGNRAQEFAGIFCEGSGLFSPTSPHVGLLWALETLAWSPRYLKRACLALGRLASVDPGGKLSNRPLGSLRDILLPWSPGTNAGAAQRQFALDAVLDAEPEVGWALLEKLLPRLHDSASTTQRPTWRDFGEARREIVTRGVASDFRRAVVSRFLARIDGSPERWETLFEALNVAFHPVDRATIPGLVEAFAAGPASAEARQAVWASIRDSIGHHRSFQDAKWSLPESELARLEQAMSSLAPSDPVERNAWLFDSQDPALPRRSDDYHEHQAAITAERVRALREIHGGLGYEGILLLAARAQLPGIVAWAVPDAFSEVTFAEALLDRTRLGDEQSRFFAGVLSARAERVFGAAWRSRLVARASAEAWPPDVIGDCLRAWPDQPETWNVVESFGSEAKRAYWSRKQGFPFGDLPVEERVRAVNEYAEVGRALTAIDAVSHGARDLPADVLADLLEAGYEELARCSEPQVLTHLRYDIQLLFMALHAAPDTDEAGIARLEYRYLPFLDHGRSAGSLVLHKVLSSDPAFFVEILTHVYKRASGGEEEPATGDRDWMVRRAEMSRRLLDSWRRLPGTDDSGSIDGQKLVTWVRQARAAATKADRAAIADLEIGKILAYAPADQDGAWPHRAVRRVLEEFDAEEIDDGLVTECFNIHGSDGWAGRQIAAQMRELAVEARKAAEAVVGEWPRTAVVLEKIAEMWESDAEQEAVRQAQRDLD